MLEINKELEKYILSHSSPEDELLQQITRATHLKVLQPRMLSGHLQGLILKMFSCMVAPKYILEIGTFTGYSAICLAKGLQPNGVLHTIDINEETLEIAADFISQSQAAQQIVIHTGSALDIVPHMDIEFDMVFIDGDKREYLDYYKLVFDKVRSGGFILADNVLWDGKIIEPIKPNDKYAQGIEDFNLFISSDLRVESVLMPFRDGMMVTRKK